jgi:hypothetical protein
MKSMPVILFMILFLVSDHPLFAQMEITKDTVYFENYGNKLTVVNTLNRQYYNDSTCVWEIMYPEVYNLGDMESTINLMLSREVAIGDCNEKICDRTTMNFPLLRKYWDKSKIITIKNDLLSYCLMEGNCPTYAKMCFSKTSYHLFNLKTGMQVDAGTLFKKDAISRHKLDSIILSKLDFVPENMQMIPSERQFYLEGNKLYAFYDTYTIGGNETYSVELQKKDIQGLINPDGILPVFFNDKGKQNK